MTVDSQKTYDPPKEVEISVIATQSLVVKKLTSYNSNGIVFLDEDNGAKVFLPYHAINMVKEVIDTKDWFDRILEERRELADKLLKLGTFLEDPNKPTVPILIEQYSAMEAYMMVLDRRIQDGRG